ncbi:MAG TPA: PEGA domain-containing protein [Polyangiaceae bacterium]|nr:PEGA domain-containing protein [Polyangiaceae bacterium]
MTKPRRTARAAHPEGCSHRSLLRTGLSTALALAALSALPVRLAHADDDATTAVARERFKEGVQYFDQKQYDKSRAAFLQAYALKRHPAVLLNLAQSELRSNHEADAAKHFAQYLREAKDATEAERQAAESGLSSAKAVVAEMTVSVDEDGATVAVDGNTEGQTPLPGPVYLSPGSHTITAKKEGREASAQVNATTGQSSSTSLRLKKAAPAAAAPAPDKDKEPTAEPAKSEAPKEPEATSSQPAESSTPPSEEPGRQRKPFIEWVTHSPIGLAGSALAVVGVGSGVGFAFASKHNYDNADEVASQIRAAVVADSLLVPGFGADPAGICGDAARQNKTAHPGEYQYACKKYRDTVDTGDTFKTVSIVSWVVAGVAIAGTAVAYFVDGTEPAGSASKKPSKVTASVAPWLSGNERGLFVTGSF